MRLLMTLTCFLFVLGCSNGGIELSSERKLQTSLDLDLLAADDLGSAEGVELLTSSVDLDSVGSKDLPAPQAVQRDSKGPTVRTFRKRRKKDSDLRARPEERPQVVQRNSQGPTVRTFGKRRKKDSDLRAGPETDGVRASLVTDVKNEVDVLFVVDGSFSTREVLRSIPERMDGFIPALSASLDWRVGFISAHVKRNKDKELSSMEIDGAIVLERKYITKRMRSKERIFIDTLTRNKNRRRCAFPPNCGGLKETPLLALTEYLLSPVRSVETGTRFIREDAHLAVVVLTDNKENKKRGDVTTADDVLDTVEQEFGSDKEFSVHTLTVMNEACQDQLKEDHFFAEGNRAGEMLLLARETGGASLSLCSYDYAAPLAAAIEKSVLGSEVDCSACEAISDKDNTV